MHKYLSLLLVDWHHFLVWSFSSIQCSHIVSIGIVYTHGHCVGVLLRIMLNCCDTCMYRTV